MIAGAWKKSFKISLTAYVNTLLKEPLSMQLYIYTAWIHAFYLKACYLFGLQQLVKEIQTEFRGDSVYLAERGLEYAEKQELYIHTAWVSVLQGSCLGQFSSY